jgi:TQXA domain-containing protein
MPSRFTAARLGALLLATATTLLVTAPAGSAATKGEYVGLTPGDNIKIEEHGSVPTSLFQLDLDNTDETLNTYCVELDVNARHGARMIESPWSDYPDRAEVFAAQPDKVLWVLHHSYPNVDLATLGSTVEAELTEREAIAGTQAAIWYFSNDAKLAADNNEDVKKLFEYLTGTQNEGIGQQPPASLTLEPSSAEATAGEPAGPFTLTSTADQVELTVEGPDGVEIVDSSGNPIEPLDKDIFGTQDKDIFSTKDIRVQDKDIFGVTEFWLSAPSGGEAAEATVSATALATVELGRLFVGEDNDQNPTQTMIVASSTPTEATAEASASWTAAPPKDTTTNQPAPTTTDAAAAPTIPTSPSAPAPQPRGSLPVTGASVLPVFGFGLLLLGAGGGALLLHRRLRRRTS